MAAPGPGTARASEPNLLVNGGFEAGDLSGWTPYYMLSPLNLGTMVRFSAREDTCDVWVPNPCHYEGDWHARIQEGQNEIQARDGLMQVVDGLTPGATYRLEMAGMIRSELPGDDYLRLWWLPRAFHETIPRPDLPENDQVNPANFPQDAQLLAQWTHADGQPNENWTVKGGEVIATGTQGTIFIDAEFFDPSWRWAIHAVYVDDARLVALPTPTPTQIPSGPDTDRDGIVDSMEGPNLGLPAGQSNWLLDDSDGDGLLDGQEDVNHSGAWDQGETSTRLADTDGDGFEDGIEVLLGMDPLVPDPGFVDSDGDGLPDSVDPDSNNRDTDGDRYDDGYEAAHFQSLAAASDPDVRPSLGDLNGDDVVTNLDALINQSLFLNLSEPWDPVFDPDGHAGFRFADPNRDGQAGNLDALLQQAFFLGNLGTLPLR